MIPFSSFVKALFVTLVLTVLGVQSLGAADGRASGSGDEGAYDRSYWARYFEHFIPEPTPEMPEPWRIKHIMEHIREKIGPKKYSLSMEESELLKDELIPHITPDSGRFNRVLERVKAKIEGAYWIEYYNFNTEPRDLSPSLKDLGIFAICSTVVPFMFIWVKEGFVDEKGVNLYERLGPILVFCQQVYFLSYLVYELAYFTRVKMCPPRRQDLRISSEDEKDIYLTALVATSLYLPLMDRYRGREHNPTSEADEAESSSIINCYVYRSTRTFKPKGPNAAFWVLNKFPELCTDYNSDGY